MWINEKFMGDVSASGRLWEKSDERIGRLRSSETTTMMDYSGMGCMDGEENDTKTARLRYATVMRPGALII